MSRRKGLATLSPERRKEISSQGGRAAHEMGRAHEWTSEEAAAAGRRGGLSISRHREHMRQIGRVGGKNSAAAARGASRPAPAAGAASPGHDMSERPPNCPGPDRRPLAPPGHGPGESAEAAHQGMLTDEALWRGLPLDGLKYQGSGDMAEHRHCPQCGTSLARPISLTEATEVCERLSAILARWTAAVQEARRYVGLRAWDDAQDDWPRAPEDFGRALRRTREHDRLTREELAKLSGVAESTIRNVETLRHRLTRSVRTRLVVALQLRGYPAPWTSNNPQP